MSKQTREPARSTRARQPPRSQKEERVVVYGPQPALLSGGARSSCSSTRQRTASGRRESPPQHEASASWRCNKRSCTGQTNERGESPHSGCVCAAPPRVLAAARRPRPSSQLRQRCSCAGRVRAQQHSGGITRPPAERTELVGARDREARSASGWLSSLPPSLVLGVRSAPAIAERPNAFSTVVGMRPRARPTSARSRRRD